MSVQASSFAKFAHLEFQDTALLTKALTHSSYAYENNGSYASNNERLEFLGDAVLQLCISQALYAHTTCLSEGKMTKVRALLVCESTLADLARSLSLGEYLLMGKGEELTGGRDKASNLANALEAVFGALFLDRGFAAAVAYIEQLFASRLAEAVAGKLIHDHKSRLLVTAQAYKAAARLQFLIVAESGPVHQRLFTAAVLFDSVQLALGEGKSKKEAEQVAASLAQDKLAQILRDGRYAP